MTPEAPQAQRTSRPPSTTGGVPSLRPAVQAMLEARSVALCGASPREGSLGQRMIAEMLRSPAAPRTYLVNPRHSVIGGVPCHGSLADLPEPVDLVLLGVPDAALEQELAVAAQYGHRSAVIFGSAHGSSGEGAALRDRLAATARAAGMALCGAGCMGFVNVAHGLRAVGYIEPDPLPAGPIALVTHSGSVFSALLRNRRAIGFTLAVSSGQELVTSAAQYAEYALSMPGTRVLALVLEAMRDPGRLRAVLAEAQAREVPVVLLAAGTSAGGRAMVSAHSGALAAADGGWEALAGAYGVHRVGDLAEMADTLEAFAIGRRARPSSGIATVHDSGLERAHVADLADSLSVPFAPISAATRTRLADVLDEGLEPGNPLDMWGTGARAQEQLAESLIALADDPSVGAVALAVDLVREFDGDRSYPLAVLDAARRTRKPVAVLGSIASSMDPEVAALLRAAGIPVLEGSRSGLLALGHVLDQAGPPPGAGVIEEAHPAPIDGTRRERWAGLLGTGLAGAGVGGPAGGGVGILGTGPPGGTAGGGVGGPPGGGWVFDLLRNYGIGTADTKTAVSSGEALAAADVIGYPVVLKTAAPDTAHKSEVAGVVLGIRDAAGLLSAYQEMAERLGPQVLVSEAIEPGTELALGIARDRDLGPLVVVGAGGILVEHFADRAVALPPVGPAQALRMIGKLRVAALLTGVRGLPPADLPAVAAAVTAVSQIACELGDHLEALDLNPLICGPSGATAVDALAIPRQ
ncbi:MAG TPA: acetate--CoA ligase family protein [Streptosporangiaceae bacterium]|nr:acetate--CoA ligase family protein [Streptosporangiaceae bacterium]